ncbi:MAG: RecQ family ATP-dependent DNA helicase, partial [Bacteroidales bacterium]|nr:RecQ family ATP-dependent DNA helicase [Bacteroidales bacterium]
MAKLQKKRLVDPEEYRQILTRFWGFTEFRYLQEEIIQSVGSGNDTLALMPTGGGKSVTFQIPALAMEGICLVVTPLIALMKDQVDQLIRRKIKAAAIHSGMARNEILTTLDNCIYGDFKFLYVSPERLGTELFRSRVRAMNVNLIAVDEAHCISQWGYDFRPSYLEIRSLREVLEGVPVLALTATATPEVCDDIQERLSFKKKNLLSKSFDRENLAYVVRKTEDKTRELTGIIKNIEGSGIVYARNRKKCRELAQLLQEEGIPADFYHAGLNQEKRDERQKGWTGNHFRVMVATNAFGMGIDKPDVRFVIHIDLPDSPESYFQEAGRAGRDGKESWAILLFSPADKRKVKERIDVNFPGIPRIREIYMALCNFLQVPLGSGKGQSYDFELGEFLHRYRFNALVAHSALSILGREGYIAITEAFNNPSRIMFAVGRDDLYSFQVRHAGFDGFIKMLLRSYSGLFSQYVKIDEAFLAKRSGLPAKQVYGYLKSLSTRKIIHYIPRKDIPVITFLEERLDEKNLLISPERYHFRRERFEKRIGEMLRYASSETLCRNQYLLSYFGQRDTPRCGRCDVCRTRNRLEPGSEEFNKFLVKTNEILAENKLTFEDLVAAIG